MEEIIELTVSADDNKVRLDKYLARKNEDLSRSYIKQLINDGNITVNDQQEKSSYKVSTGDEIVIEVPEAEEIQVEPENIPIDILYEDDDIIVVNKDWNMVVHPAPFHEKGTLVNALLYHCDNLSGINGRIRPGIVHRLDKDTSGVLVVAKSDMANRSLINQFKNREVDKVYKTLVKGYLSYNVGEINAPIGRNPKYRKLMAVVKENSKPAVTHFEVEERFRDYTWVEVKIETGRTHQIRVHFSYMDHPVVGDDKYGYEQDKLPVKRQMLHAYQLSITHPRTGKAMTFTAPIPGDIEEILEELRENNAITS